MGTSRDSGLLVLFAVALTRCAVPHASLARPVAPAPDGAVMLGGGVLVPFAAAISAHVEDDSTFSDAVGVERVLVVPGGSVVLAVGGGYLFGVDVSVFSSALVLGEDVGPDSLGFFVNPNLEIPLGDPAARRLSFTVDTNLGYLRGRSGDESTGTPFLSPTAGIRGYVPTGFGGFVVAQQIGTGLITLTFPGSLAYDVPIALGAATLHLFPELHWDPTLWLFSDLSGAFVLLSGGLSMMLEL